MASRAFDTVEQDDPGRGAGLTQEPSPRVLILSATVGSSHNSMAAAMEEDILGIDPAAEVTVLKNFQPLGRRLGSYIDWSFKVHFGRLGWSYDLTYLLFTRNRQAQRFGESSLYRIAGSNLAAAIAEHRADVVVSTHPVFNPVLSGLRRDGRLRSPAATVICELGGLEFWLQPQLDDHFTIYPEAAAVVRESLPGARADAVRPLVSSAFYREPDLARIESQVPPGDGPVVLISGGGWGLGDLEGAVEGALAVPGARVIVVAGQNEQARRSLARRYAAGDRTTVLGFTTAMSDLLGAADVFVHTTVGTSCLEARLRGVRTICFGLFVGHIRDNAAALSDYGYAVPARSQAELAQAIARCLDQEPPQQDWKSLPSAGEAVLSLVREARAAVSA